MPTDTFFNLPDSKRKKITELAVEEFALHDYKSASLSRIVERAGIAKGSMYQYFKNKKELYYYIVKVAADKKLNTVREKIKIEDKNNLFELLKEMHLVGLEFDLNYPRYSRVIINAMNETSQEFNELSRKLISQSDNFFIDYVKYAREKGQIRKDLDVNLISFLLSRVSLSIQDYLSFKYNFSYTEIIKDEKKDIPVSKDKLDKELDDFMDFLKNGLKQKG